MTLPSNKFGKRRLIEGQLLFKEILQYSRATLNWGRHFNRFTARVDDGVCEVVLSLLRLWTKSYGATIQIKSLQQYFHMVLFIRMWF